MKTLLISTLIVLTFQTTNVIGQLKNGVVIEYNGNKTINYLLTYKNDKLNGYFEVNWSAGEKNYNGFYKNDYRDSIWTYYDNNNKLGDSSKTWVSEKYQYKNRKRYLLSAWNNQGLQTVTNGNGIVVENHSYDYYRTTTTYRNGLKNGKEIKQKPNGMKYSEEVYKDNLLIKQTIYYDSNKLASVSEWSYPFPEKSETKKAWIDTYITSIFYNQITYTNKPVRNNHWISYFPNGVKEYEGDFTNNKKVKKWNWFYSNGKQRITADFTTNSWKHFDTSGNLISTLSKEYLTYLNDYNWFLNQELDSTIVTFTDRNKQTVTPRFIFHYDGLLEINSYLECGKDIDFTTNSYILLADTLTIIRHNRKTDSNDTFKFRIKTATKDKIEMTRIDTN